MATNAEASVLRANKLIQKFYDKKVISSNEADKAKQEYQSFLNTVIVENKDNFLSFDLDDDRLDKFLGIYLHGNVDYVNVWKVCKITMVLSHG